jgi:glycosyltransferase involved in cell wall biosynthesis
MSQLPPFAPEVEARVRELGTAEIVVGIPSYNNAATIGHVVRAAAAGLAKYFPDRSSVIVNSDGGSKDGTPDVVARAEFQAPRTLLVSHALNPVHKIITPYHGIPGKGSAFRTVFGIAERLGARACAVVDSDLQSVTPEWFELLLGPVLQEGYDFVAPLYRRHKYDGTITNSIVYPLTRALYGQDVRQPIGGDFGFSGTVVSHYLRQPVWDSNVARFGIDIWMTTTAIAEGYRICQAFLGAKIHDAKDPGSDLSQMFIQVLSSVFDLMSTYAAVWRKEKAVSEVALFGFPHGVGLAPIHVDVGRMERIFRQAVRDLGEVWQRFLAPDTLRGLQAAVGDGGSIAFPDALWVSTIYEAAIGYRKKRLPAEQLLGSLVPIYLGRTASFVHETGSMEHEEVEGVIRRLADEYARQRAMVVSAW